MREAPIVRSIRVRWEQPRWRWGTYVVLALLFAVLAVVPRQHVARGKIVPDSTSANALMSVFGALGGGRVQNFASLFGDRGTIELALAIGRSQSITDDVIRAEKLVGPGEYATMREAQLGLSKKVDVFSLTGGMLEVQTRSTDPEWALRITKAYLAVITRRLSVYGADQTARKRRIVQQRTQESIDRLARAEGALNAFKRRNQLPDPEQQLGAELALTTQLEGQLQAKLLELATVQQTAGDENPELREVQTQVATLRRQIAEAKQRQSAAGGLSAAGISAVSLQYANLYQQFLFAQGMYEVYSKSAEEVAVQEIASQNSSEATIVDPPHVDPERYYNTWAVALLGLLILVVVVIEFYGPATGMWRKDTFVETEPA